MKTIKKQFLFALILFLVYYLVSTAVYTLYGDPGTTVADAIYMTGISFTTVGYGDTGFASTSTQKILFTPLFIWGFLIQIIFVASAVNAFIALKVHIKAEELLMKVLAKFKRKHIVIFGIGKISPHIIEEFVNVKASFIVADRNPVLIEELREKYRKIHVMQISGKTPTEADLKSVNIAKANVAIFDLGSDELNHIAGDMVQRANGGIRVLAVNDQRDFLPIMSTEGKMAINRHELCAMRIASLAFRPAVVNYLDKMLYKQDGVYRVEEITVLKGASLVGETVKEIFEATGLKVLLVGVEDREIFDVIPRGKLVIQADMTLFVQGEASEIGVFRRLAENDLSIKDINTRQSV